ncbi:transglycosylase domain-containing protein [Oceanobacillus saliphilus]|uniref:transglycosylase domain-containing protein n=1 Tax=Oceanobacillus saliphilus TaxID=2925834 RepID=UPI00201D4DA5|nr:transglycosylase domain-containing protein [Oceanobacillus saliphilus]
MNFKEKFLLYMEKFKSLWKTGKIQRSSRITYDVVWNVILFFIIIGLVLFIFVGGIGAGYFASLVKDEPLRSYETMAKDIYDYSETSKLYFADNVYFGDVRSDIYREETTLDDISPILLQAVIATEDEYFSEHNGVVPKAILRAVVQEVTNSSVQTGGSTLTQQLIKNQILTNEVSFERKAKEILLAMRLEQFFEKDEILEAYLNIIPYGRNSSGRNIAGVQTAAQGIFGINADEVNIPQAAYLAGLPQSPSAYTPFVNTGGLKDESGIQPGLNRMQTVLNRMYDMEYITKEELDEALAYDIVADFKEDEPSPNETYPYLTFEIEKRAKAIIKNILLEQDGYTSEDLLDNDELSEEYDILADRAMRMNGYEIHSTIDKEIYDVFQEIAKNYQYYGNDRTFTKTNENGETYEVTDIIQTGGMLIENSTGRIISFVGGRGHHEGSELNYATQAYRSIGSTIKPLLDYAPAMEKGVVQPGTPIADYDRSYAIPGQGNWEPKNYGGGYYGIVSARTAFANSYNIPAADTYLKIIDDDPATQYLKKMGITSLTPGDHSNLSLSLGAMAYGITVEENVNAFSTFGNNGKFADGYMIEKITTKDGEVVYEHVPEPVEVFSPQTNYLTVDMMRDVISNGTAGYVNSQLKHSGVDWAGKTGTSNDYHDAWFVATNPNVTFGTWIGYDTPYPINHPYSISYSQRNLKLWSQLINAAADIRPDLVAPTDRFERPDGIVERSYCAISGMLPSELCEKAGLVKTDIFNSKFVPTEIDDSLITGNQVIVDGKSVMAGPNTPSEFVVGNGLTFNPDWLARNGYDELSDLTKLYPRTEREKWEKIGIPSSKIGTSNRIEDDGKAPDAPTSVKKEGNNLTWTKPGSKDVVGYRVYRSDSPGGNFKLIGSTTSTNYGIGNGNAVYTVKAVDYFGLESKASSEVIVGETPKEEKETPDQEEDNDTEETSADEESSNENNSEETNSDEADDEEDNGGSNEDDSNDEEENTDDEES